MQTKYHYIATKIAKIKKTDNMLSVGEDVEQLALIYIAGWSVKWYKHFQKSVGSFL